MSDPNRIVVAGDWHGAVGWAMGVIRRLPELLPDESPRMLVHCGDFGVWPGTDGERYVHKLNRELARADAILWFVDGNHEWHSKLADLPQVDGMGWVADRIWHLPRGHRWTWHDRTWLALGGAASLDRARRTEGKTWWPAEEITTSQALGAIRGGPADTMITHDCPAKVTHTFPARPSWWHPDDLTRSDVHQGRLQMVVDAVQPAHLIHGHLHKSYTRTLDMGWGPIEVTGLDCDGAPSGNWAVLDVKTMGWGPAHE